jgi:type I restriction enzyme, S subunit
MTKKTLTEAAEAPSQAEARNTPLPNGWELVRIGDLCVERVAQAPPDGRPVDYIDIGSINRDTKTIGGLEKVSSANAPTRARQWVRPGDVLVSMTRPNLNAVAIVPPSLDGAVASTGFDVLRPIGALPSWVFNRVRSHAFVSDVCEGLQGVVYPAIRPHDVRQHKMPLPPLPEQHRIIAAIESYFTRLDDAVANMERVERNLKRYRASVLKAAVEGRLLPTEAKLARAEGRHYEPASVLLNRILAERRRRWEKSRRRGTYNEPVAPEMSNLPEPPEGWCWTTVDQLTSGDRKSAYGVLVPGPDLIDGVPLIRVGDIESGSVRTDNLKHISRAIADRFSKTYLRGSEVLITLVGTIGRTAVVPESLAGSNVARAVGVVPVNKLVSPNWVEIWFRSPAQRYSLEQKAHEVARKTLNLEDVRAAVVCLPPLQEQLRVCEAVEDLNSLAAAAAKSARADLLRCTRLRQAILRWAFEGKLADQDLNDEPAPLLPERSRAERASGGERSQERRGART